MELLLLVPLNLARSQPNAVKVAAFRKKAQAWNEQRFAARPCPRMDIYLPIAGQSVNALCIVILGFLVGLLSGMFGIGGGFLTTPLLLFYGIPPTVAVACAATQITGASVSGVMVHMRCGGVDMKMSGVMSVGGLFGAVV